MKGLEVERSWGETVQIGTEVVVAGFDSGWVDIHQVRGCETKGEWGWEDDHSCFECGVLTLDKVTWKHQLTVQQK